MAEKPEGTKMKRLSLLPLLVLLTACPTSAPVVTAVAQAVIDDAALITALSDPALTAAQKTRLLAYANAASVSLGEVSIVLASGGTATQMGLTIAADLAPVVAPVLPALPAAIVTALGAEAADIQAILNQYGPAASQRAVGVPAVLIQFSGADQKRLKSAHAKAVENEARIAVIGR